MTLSIASHKSQATQNIFDLSTTASRERILEDIPVKPEEVMSFFGGMFQASKYLKDLFESVEQSLATNILSQADADDFISKIKANIFSPLVSLYLNAQDPKKINGLSSYLTDLCVPSSQVLLVAGLTVLIEEISTLSNVEIEACLLQGNPLNGNAILLEVIFAQINHIKKAADKNNLIISLCKCLNNFIQTEGLPNQSFLSALENLQILQLFSCMQEMPEFKHYMLQVKGVAGRSRLENTIVSKRNTYKRSEFTEILKLLAEIAVENPETIKRIVINNRFFSYLLRSVDLFEFNSAKYNIHFAKIVDAIGEEVIYEGMRIINADLISSCSKSNVLKFFAHNASLFMQKIILFNLSDLFNRASLCLDQVVDLLAIFNHLNLFYHPADEQSTAANIKPENKRIRINNRSILGSVYKSKLPYDNNVEKLYISYLRKTILFDLVKLLNLSSSQTIVQAVNDIKQVYFYLQPVEKTFILELLGGQLHGLYESFLNEKVLADQELCEFFANALCAEKVGSKTRAFVNSFSYIDDISVCAMPSEKREVNFSFVEPIISYGLEGFLRLRVTSSDSPFAQRLIQIELDPQFSVAVQGSAVQYINDNHEKRRFPFSQTATRKQIIKAKSSVDKQTAVPVDAVTLYPDPCNNGKAYAPNADTATMLVGTDALLQSQDLLVKVPSAPLQSFSNEATCDQVDDSHIFDGTERKLPSAFSTSVIPDDNLVASEISSESDLALLPVASAVVINASESPARSIIADPIGVAPLSFITSSNLYRSELSHCDEPLSDDESLAESHFYTAPSTPRRF